MRALAFLLALLLGSPAWAQIPPAFVQGPAAAASYTGPGDVVSGAAYWGGVWAYSAAQRGTKALNVCNVSDVACADLSTDATTGALTVTTIGGSSCSVVTCTVKTIYDQSGNAHDFTQATIANRGTLTNSGCPAGTSWCIGGLGDTTFYTYATSGTGSQPITVSGVFLSTLASTNRRFLIAASDNSPFTSVEIGSGGDCSTSDSCLFSTTLGPQVATTNNTWYALQAVFNGASPGSVLLINGTSATGSTSGSSWNNAGYPKLFHCCSSGNFGLNGRAVEIGWWTSAFNGTQQSNMESNERTRNNF